MNEEEAERVERRRKELLEKCRETLSRKWAEQQAQEEPVFRYVVEFECTPSVFDHIKRVIATQRTFNRLFRYYTIRKGHEVIREWQNRT